MTHLENAPTRRALLRGAGAMLALPVLESLLPRRAFADSPAVPPKRMAIFTVTGGTVLESWAPKQPGALGTLPSILRPLQPYKDDILVVSGLCNASRSDNLNAHEHCASTHLTCAEAVKREGGRLYAGVSVDQVVARACAEETLLPSLEIGRTFNQYSFRSRDVVVPFEQEPRLIFERMFRGRQPVVPNWNRRAAALAGAVRASAAPDSPEASVLDLVRDQARDLRRKVGAADRQKLEGYLDSVRSVERRIGFVESRRRVEAAELKDPGPSKLVAVGKMPADWWKMVRLMDHDPEFHGEYIRLLADLMILAFQTDTTRVATVAAGSDDAMFPGVVTVGYESHCHTLEHQGNAGRPEDADPISREALRQIHVWYTAFFAELLGKMKAVDEGGSTLLDNSLILYTSYMADGGHGRDDYPVLLAGRAGGRLKTGRHLAFPKKAPVANLYLAMMSLMGVQAETFGDALTSRFAGSYNGRLPGIS